MKKIFISYSHKEEEWKDRVDNHLRVFQLEGKWRTWDDRQIPGGSKWEEEIIEKIQTAHAAVLLISTAFLISDFIKTKEVPWILERWQKNEIIVFPVIIEPCSWQAIPWLKQMQVFPKDGIPLEKWEPVQIKENLTLLAEKLNQLLWNLTGAAAGDGEAEGNPRSASLPGQVKTTLLTGLPKRQIKFLGREKELTDLEKKIHQSERVLLVNGLGGIGKTEVCKRFFMDHYSRYHWAGWIDYLGTIKESLVNAMDTKITGGSRQDTMDERFELLKEFLCQLEGNALLIIDNLDNPGDPDLDLFKSLPPAIKVIATSRELIHGFDEYPLDVLPKESCRELFYEFYKGPEDNESVNRLLELCGCHTLTVELLARTAFKEKLPVGELVELLEKKGFNLDKVICEPVGTYWHDEQAQKVFYRHLRTVFDISKLTRQEKHAAANLAVLPSVYIPAKDVCAWLGLSGKKEINGLLDKGWLKQDEGYSLYMHPVVREVVRQKTTPTVKTCEKLIESLIGELYLEPGANPIDKQGYVIFAEEVIRHLEEKIAALATLANNLSMIYKDLGQLDRALEFQLKTAEIFEQILDKNHPSLATSYNNLSLIYQALGQLDRALEFQLKAVEIREQVLSKNHPDIAQSYNNLSLIYQALGQLDRALEFQLKTLEIKEQILSKNHPSLATSYNNLSSIYQALVQLDRALEFQLKDVEISEQILDKNHPDLATSYNNLSLIYQALGQLDRARPYAQKAVDILTSLFPHGHPNLDIARRTLEGLQK